MQTGRNLAIAFITAGLVLLSLLEPTYAQAQQFKPHELLVKFKANVSSTSLAGVQNAASAQQVQTIGLGNIHRITLSPDVSVHQAMAIYANHPEVLFAEPNYRLKTQALPNDPDFDLQWALRNMGQVVAGYVGTPGADLESGPAWEITSGSSSVVVAVLDSGCDYNHPDLTANIWTNVNEIADNGIDDDNNGFVDDYYGWDFSDNDPDPQDGTGHGTHVAGIIAAQGNNNLGISGIAWQARIMPVRFIDTFNTGYTDDAIEAIRYAVAQGARIINCSWGSSDYSSALRDEMANSDALFICAAGNTATDTDITGFYPAGYDADNIIAVAASDQMDRLTYFSNFGKARVDVTAPGIRIYSLQNGRQTFWQDDFSDLSMAGWTTGGNGNTWGVSNPPATSDAPALATSPDQDYANDADMWAQTSAFDLRLDSTPELVFRLIGLSEAEADHLFIEASVDGINWSQPPLMIGSAIQNNGISGTVPYWMPAQADLNRWEKSPQLFLRMRFQSNSSVTQGGFYLDDFELTTAAVQNSYAFMDGTSMASAFVSGLAALIVSQNDTLTVLEIKTIIENSVDVDLDLVDQVASGGRVNAFNALTLLNDLSLSANTATADRITLSWDTLTPLDAGVMIERRTEGQADFETVAQVNADITQYDDRDVGSDATYYYRMQAHTQDGRSGYSNQTLATTLEQPGSSSGGGSSGGCFIGLSVTTAP